MPTRDDQRSTFAAALLVLLALSALPGPAAAASVRGQPWIALADGRRGDFSWSVRAKRQKGSGDVGRTSGHRPCLRVGMTLRFGPYDYRRTRYRTCADAEGRLGTAEAPLIASSAVPSNGRIALTAVGMISAPPVRRVRITLCDGRVTTVALHRMSPRQARATGMRRLRYVALVVRGAWCAERLVSIGARGQSLWDSGA